MCFDQAFISRLKKGDEESFEKLFLDTYESLCEYSVSITRSKEAAEGVVQDVFEAVWQNRTGLEDDINIRAYLFRSVKNRSVDVIKHEKIRTKYQRFILQSYQESFEKDDDYEYASRLMKRVHEEIENLPEKIKMVYLLHRRDGLTYKEIALVLEISVKSVEARMTKALKILRERLSDEKDMRLLPILILFPF